MSSHLILLFYIVSLDGGRESHLRKYVRSVIRPRSLEGFQRHWVLPDLKRDFAEA